MNRQYCHFHADDDIAGVRLNDEGGYTFTCEHTSGHPQPGSYTWLQAPEPPDFPGLSGLADELGLQVELPAAIARNSGRWVEYGVVEAAYAEANPVDFARLVERYGHTAIKAKNYTASAFIAATLGRLSRSGDVLFHAGPATGRWDYNQQISWWALAPDPDWATRTSWQSLEMPMTYVPGATEICPKGWCTKTDPAQCPH
ncbi:hypothetical protein SAMN04489844_0242 [Nocardioides exalbidus]|uniref:Uncharacterized protein n=1 Tax=Nocardioides exalbidus TaxID=402596 RepID=A0A1H4JRN2_9ACTN|nr:hypothetical protein [Nocardioides exalbidus]SEB48272.1 hypothetical protein SAMN04489844_0242 [Nocardioides exalbidus]